jgi:hypothetical protein
LSWPSSENPAVFIAKFPLCNWDACDELCTDGTLEYIN